MAFRIQRVPRALGNLLNLFGGETPAELEDRLRSTLDLLQFYGLTQLTTLTTGGVRAQGASIDQILSATNWTILFAASVQASRTATQTALDLTCYLQRGGAAGSSNVLFSREYTLFGAPGNSQLGGYLSYPLLCPPDTRVRGVADILGTDANLTLTVTAEVGVLG